MFRQEHQQRLLISAVIAALHEAKKLPYVLPSLPPIVSEAVLVDGHTTDDAINVPRQALPALHIVKQA
jgi:molybdenum cofactor biosynthesis enzyme